MDSALIKKLLEVEDLKRLIFSFGEVEHRSRMRKVCSSFGYNTELPAIKYYGKELLSPIPRLYLKMRQIFPDQVNPDDDEEMGGWYGRKGYTLMDSLIWFYKLRRCQCCSRHSHRKPDIVMGHILGRGLFFKKDYGPRIPEDKDLGDCRCQCRHEARYLCHMIQERTNGF